MSAPPVLLSYGRFVLHFAGRLSVVETLATALGFLVLASTVGPVSVSE